MTGDYLQGFIVGVSLTAIGAIWWSLFYDFRIKRRHMERHVQDCPSPSPKSGLFAEVRTVAR